MRTPTDLSSLVIPFALFAVNCGGSTPPAATPAETETPAAEPAAAAATDQAAAPADTKPAAAQASAPEAASHDEGEPGPLQKALTKPNVVFMFSFNDSDTKKVAEQTCGKESKGDAKKQAECMTKAQKNIDLDGLRFKQDGDKWLWITVRRQGNALVTLHKVEFAFGTETGTTISIKTQGKDKGSKPWAKVPAEVVFEVPNSDQVVQTDAQRGKLVYEAKLGLVND